MIVNKIQTLGKYAYLAEKFEKAFRFLREQELLTLPAGRYEIDGEEVYAMVQEYETSPFEELKMESHRRYFDIQYVAEGREIMEMAYSACLTVDTPYEEKADVAFYQDPELCSRVYLESGQFAVVSPEEAHKPRCAAGAPEKVRKVVLKIRV